MRSDQTCRRVSALLTATGGHEPPPGDELDHLRRCLRCQAEGARLRRLGRALETLDEARFEPPPDLLPETLRLLSDEPARRRRGRSRAELAAIAAAATGALVLGRRLRHIAS